MVRIKDEIAACGMTAVLWDEIVSKYSEKPANSEEKYIINKSEVCEELFGKMKHSCPCCEFAKSNSPEVINKKQLTGVNCRKCPMKDFWSKDENKNGYNCENEDSPYMNWEFESYTLISKQCASRFESYRIMRKRYASRIVSLAMDAMEYWKAMKSMNITW